MKLAFVAHSHGNVALLERVLVNLLERYQADRVVALETAATDAEAVLRSRALRFPEERTPDDVDFADFVLASVLSGADVAPPVEVERTARLRAALVFSQGGGQVFDVDGHRIGVGVTAVDPATLSAVVLTGVERRALARDEAPVRVAPGHLRASQHEGEPAACLLVEVAEGQLTGHFIGADGLRIGRPEPLHVVGM